MNHTATQQPGIVPQNQPEQPVIPTLREALNSVQTGHNITSALFSALGDEMVDEPAKPEPEPVALEALARQLQVMAGGLANRLDTLSQRLGS